MYICAVAMLLFLSAVQAAESEVTPPPAVPVTEPTLDELRYAASVAFLGSLSLEDKGDVNLAGRVFEEELVAPCHPIPWVKNRVEQLFELAGFRQAGQFLTFSQHGGTQERPLGTDGARSDRTSFYFEVKKASMDCTYRLGLITGRWNRQVLVPAKKSSELIVEMQDLLGNWKKAIETEKTQGWCPELELHSDPEGGGTASLEKWLDHHSSTDSLTKSIVERVQKDVPRMTAAIDISIPEIRVVVFDGKAMPEQVAIKLGTSCVLIGLPKPTVACNETFLALSEIAIRSYSSDGWVFSAKNDVVDRAAAASQDPYLARNSLRRKMVKLGPSSEATVFDLMVSALRYYVAHEIGHLAQCELGGKFDQPPLVTAQDASLKMCRHLTEFGAIGMSDRAPYVVADTGPRDLTRQAGAGVLAAEAIYQRRFSIERLADDYAIYQILSYLSYLDRTWAPIAQYAEWMTAQAIFITGFFSWAQSTGNFGERYCPTWAKTKYVDSVELSRCMAKSVDSRINAATMFGQVHPFMMLRAHRLLVALVSERLLAVEEANFWNMSLPEMQHVLNTVPKEGRKFAEWRMKEFRLAQYLFMFMDAPFKLASIGCTTPWVATHMTKIPMYDSFFSVEETIRMLDDPSLGEKLMTQQIIKHLKENPIKDR